MCKTSAVTEYPTTKDRRLRIRSIPFPHVPLGRLRIGFHGLAGTTALFFTSLAILNVASGDGRPPPTWLSVCVLLTTIWSSVGSMSLFHQVPKQTVIARNVVPPHKEAFARTVSVTWTGAATATTASSPVQWFWACMLVAHTCATMIPRPLKTAAAPPSRTWRRRTRTTATVILTAISVGLSGRRRVPRRSRVPPPSLPRPPVLLPPNSSLPSPMRRRRRTRMPGRRPRETPCSTWRGSRNCMRRPSG
mmetsp:Transcript_8503/g.17485  ORF Transcript_8503/g.17485 Transcript_8503/m.17485 type:complete len:248 (+) Transcript_8503:71-814(+)